jgi:threonine aldolase
MNQYTDFRSDTVTQPTKEMLEAMFSAQVGDDVFGEDPTINALEEKTAKIFGMEAALFCSSGTMTNQIALNVHLKPGEEVICSRQAHIYNYEGGGIAKNSGASVRLIETASGLFTAKDVEENINPDDVHYTVTSLVSVENTSNRGGGVCFDFSELEAIKKVCLNHGLNYHIDGARLFNAMIKNNETPEQYGQLFDSISICLSKSLGCPVGSLLLGDKEFIKQARRVRKVFGGGMRQAGYLAAAGIYALDHHITRLADDHKRAKELAAHVSHYKYITSVIEPETNIVVFYLENDITPQAYCEKLKEKGVLAIPFGAGRIRMVTHLNIDDSAIEKAVEAMKKL